MKTLRPMMALLLVLTMVISLIPCTFATTESSTQSGYVATDPYVYHYDVDGNGYDGPKFQYFSPYYACHQYDSVEKGRNNIFLYTIYNSVSGKEIPAYSVDIFTGAFYGNRYRCVNPNDSTFAFGDGNVLSAILLGGFYVSNEENETAEQHTARVDAKLAELAAATGVADLTIGEAICATQLAIWRAAHGSLLTYDPLVYRFPFESTDASRVRYVTLSNTDRTNGHYQKDGSYLTEESMAYLNSRIRTVLDYLLALEPVDSGKGIISVEAIGGAHERASIYNGDGTYDIEITVYLDASVGAEDSLMLAAMVDPTHYVQVPLKNGCEQYELLIPNVPEECLKNENGQIKDVTVAIDGVQSASQVIFLESEGGTDKSTTMIGMDNYQVPVHVETTVELENPGQYIPRNPYVYSYGIEENEPYRYQYHSPYTTQYSYEDHAGIVQSFGYSLYNSVTENTINAYCADILTGAFTSHTYRRLNLEDSASGIREPGILRAVMMEGFYLATVAEETEEEHAARAEAKLASLREAIGMEDLTYGEAISATQLAVWKAAHGTELEFPDMVRGVVTATMGSSLVRFYDMCNREIEEGHVTLDKYGFLTAESDAYVTSRIETLYNYLIGLEPVWKTKHLVSQESFGGLHEQSVVRNLDGTYDISIDAYVDVSLEEGDRLTITAMVDPFH